MKPKVKAVIIIIVVIILIISLAYVIANQILIKPECKDYSVEDCPGNCVICPPCEVCSSVSCQTEEFCESIGFDKNWYENVTGKNS